MDVHLLTDDPTLQEDLQTIASSSCIEWDELEGRTILVTGATGYIGSVLTRALLLRGLKVIPLVRSISKSRKLFGDTPCIVGDICRPIVVPDKIDYIIHAASVTTSKTMVDQPYETILTTVEGTRNVLELAREKSVRGMVYLSSMEVYGTPSPNDCEMTEVKQGFVDPLSPRSSYPQSKRMAEGLCAAVAHEYGVPVRIARLAQTFGAGVDKTENRVFAQFARAVMNGSDIVLKTDGSKSHCYCYISDAVIALLMLLTQGVPGEAYNVSNEDTFCSIREMAEDLITAHSACGSRLVFDIGEDAKRYPPAGRMKIMNGKLRALGWEPKYNLREMFDRLMASLRYGGNV